MSSLTETPLNILADIKTREMLEEAIEFADARPDARAALYEFLATSKSDRGNPSKMAISSNPKKPSDRLVKALSDPDAGPMMTTLIEFASAARGRISLKQFLNRKHYELQIPHDPDLVIHEVSRMDGGYGIFGIEDKPSFIKSVSDELVRCPNKFYLNLPERRTNLQIRCFASIAARLATLADQETISLLDLVGGRLDYGISTEAHQGFQSIRAAAEDDPAFFAKDMTALTSADLDRISHIDKVGPRTFREIVTFKRLVEHTDHFKTITVPQASGPAQILPFRPPLAANWRVNL